MKKVVGGDATRSFRSPWAAPTALAILGLGLACAMALRQREENATMARAAFRTAADRTLTQLQRRLQTYEYEVRGARGAVIGAGGEAISRVRFREYAASRDIPREFPGSQGFGFIRRVPRVGAAEFLAVARAEGPSSFSIQQLAPHDGDHFVIQYIEPLETNRRAVGLDIASEANRREAAQRAALTGEATLTAPLDLLQDNVGETPGFLLLLATYRADVPTDGADRARAVVGWAYAPLTVAGVMAGVDHAGALIELRLSDRPPVGGSLPIFSTRRYAARSSAAPLVVTFPVFGRTWQAEVSMAAGFLPALHLRNPAVVAAGVALIGFLTAGILYAYLWILRRKLAVAAEKGLLASIVQSSADAIIAENLTGTVTSWNEGATRLFGYSVEEMVGRSMEKLYPAEEWKEIESLRPSAGKGTVSRQMQAVRIRKDGGEVQVAITRSPIRDGLGSTIGISVVARDITEQVKADLALRAEERRFRDLAQSLPHMVWTCQGDGPCDYLSPQWVAYTGLPEAAQLGYAWLEQLHPDDVERTRLAWAAAASMAGIFDVEFRVRRHDGIYRWFKTRATPIQDQTGRVIKWFGSNTDIQDLRDTEDALRSVKHELEARVLARTSELATANVRLESLTRQLQAAQRIARVGSWELDVPSGIASWSRELHRILGTDPDGPTPLYQAQQPLFAPASWAALGEAIERTVATGLGYELRLEFIRPDGVQGVAIARGEPAPDQEGKVTHLFGTFQDVTDDEQVRLERERLAARLQLATSAAKMGVWDWDIGRNVLIWDDIMRQLYDTAERGFSGVYDAWRSALHPADLASTEKALTDAVAGARDFDPSFRIVRPNGEIRHLRAAAVVHRDTSTGAPLRMVGVNWDITEQRNAEESLRSSEALQRAILVNAGSAIIATDPSGTISLFNRAAEELLGYQASEVVGKTTPAIIHDLAEVKARWPVVERDLGITIDSAFDVFVARSRTGKADANEWTYLRKDGSRVSVLLTVSTLRDGSGEIFGYLGMAVDLSAQKRHEGELRDLNRLLQERTRQAESASTAKSMFLANMSHEIRTPIGAITGVTYLLGRSVLSADQRRLVQTIERSSKTLLSMINDILDLSKIEAGQLTLDQAPFRLSTVIDDAADLLAGYAIGKSLELILDLDPKLPDALMGDQVRLMQILINLIGNAVKFTELGWVRLSVRCEETTDQRARLRFEVADSGPGIHPDVLPRLFAPFAQGEQSPARRVGGTGLGLAIVKQLASMMGGEVGVESTLGRGSRFWSSIPFRRGEAPDEARSGQRLSVLVVDDHDVQRMALLALMQRLGWEGVGAPSGEQALALIRERTNGPDPFDAVVLDWRMPGMDGVQTLAELRRMATADARLAWPTVIMATAHDQALLRAVPEVNHAGAILGKPVTPTALLRAVMGAISTRPGPPRRAMPTGGPPAGPAARLRDLRILLADDSELNLTIARRILEEDGARVVTARDGREAVDRVLDQVGGFDVVLMDVQMPVVDGIQATRLIRRELALANLPIIALTAGALATDRQQALEAGMTDFVSKPYNPDDLIACVGRHVALSLATPEPALPAIGGEWLEIDGIEGEDARRRMGGNVPLFRSLLRLISQEMQELHATLALPLQPSGFDELSRRVHRLRGGAGNVGAIPLSREAAETESALRAGDVPAAEAAVARLVGEMIRLQRSLAQVDIRVPTDDHRHSPAPLPPVSEPQWVSFRDSLEQQSLDALALLPVLSQALRERLGTLDYEKLCAALDKLDFATASSLVQGLASSSHPQGGLSRGA